MVNHSILLGMGVRVEQQLQANSEVNSILGLAKLLAPVRSNS